jgi:hypothetical protein
MVQLGGTKKLREPIIFRSAPFRGTPSGDGCTREGPRLLRQACGTIRKDWIRMARLTVLTIDDVPADQVPQSAAPTQSDANPGPC